MTITVGVLALQGAFDEHVQCLDSAAATLGVDVRVIEVRTEEQLSRSQALVIPGGESTAISLIAARSGLLQPLRDYVKSSAGHPVWGTCAGLILLSDAATRSKATGQDLIGGLRVRVNRNYFGRQTESFQADMELPWLDDARRPFKAVFIRAPVVEEVLQVGQTHNEAGVVTAPTTTNFAGSEQKVEILARLPSTARSLESPATADTLGEKGDIVAVRQGNLFGTSFHPELTGDARIHVWWLKQVVEWHQR